MTLYNQKMLREKFFLRVFLEEKEQKLIIKKVFFYLIWRLMYSSFNNMNIEQSTKPAKIKTVIIGII